MPSTNTLGRYQILREIARSNDIVYEAFDPIMKRRVAVKELSMPPNLAGEQRRSRIERFYREARAAGTLTHANIVTIYEVGEEQGRHFIAMEYLEGESLRDRLQATGVLSLEEAVRIAAAVADGIHFAHQNGVVHRDVKPDNIHLLPDGRVKITDFGIARITFEPTLTADGQIFGTPSYMSPEQVTGKGIDARSDIFSLGVMLYEMVTGRKPFTGDSVITITYNIMNLDPSPAAGAPPEVQQLIRRAMAKNPGQRYRTAAEMASELRSVNTRGLRAGSLPTPQPTYPAPSYPPPGGQPAPYPPRSGAAPYRAGAPPGAARAPLSPGPAAAIPRPAPSPMFPSSQYPPVPLGRAGTPPRRVAVPAVPGPVPGRVAGYPPGGAVAGAAPAAYTPPIHYGPPRLPSRPLISQGTLWFLGWLSVAIVAALILLVVIWSATNYMENSRTGSATAPSGGGGAIAAEAKRAADSGDDFRAWQLYKEAAAKGEGPKDQLNWNAAICAVNYAGKQADPNEARRACEEALTLAPDYGDADNELATLALRQSQIEEAQTYFDAGIAAWKHRRDQSGLSQDDRDQAVRELQAMQQSEVNALIEDGQKHVAAGEMEIARKRFEDAVRTAPAGSDAYKQATDALRSVSQPASSGR